MKVRMLGGMVTVLLLAAVQLIQPVPALAASPGDLDRSFGVGGVVVTGFTPRSYQDVSAVAVLADGRIVVAGSAGASDSRQRDFAVVRYTVDGALDTTFGNRGFVHTD